MYTFLVVLHLVVCFFLIFIVLIQSSKGAEMGSAFGGGSSQTLFGGRGATTFLAKLTTSVAVLFMITSLTLALFSINRTSIVSDVPARQETKSPLTDTAGPLTSIPDAAPVTETGTATETPAAE